MAAVANVDPRTITTTRRHTIADCLTCGQQLYLSSVSDRWLHWQTGESACPAGANQPQI